MGPSGGADVETLTSSKFTVTPEAVSHLQPAAITDTCYLPDDWPLMALRVAGAPRERENGCVWGGGLSLC